MSKSTDNKSIATVLNKSAARKYFLKHHGFFSILSECFSCEERLIKKYDKVDILANDKFRDNLRKTLSSDENLVSTISENWSSLLKPKINILEMWSGLFSTLSALVGFGAGIVSFYPPEGIRENALWLMAAFWPSLLILLLLKFYVDRTSVWYKFICSHLDAISKEGSNKRVEMDAQKTRATHA